MKDDVIYIKIPQNVEVTNKKVYVGDLGTIFCANKALEKELGNQVLMVVDSKQDMKYMFSILKVVEIASKLSPQASVVNLGETDFILSYKVPQQHKKWLEYGKTALVCLSIFFGAAFTIMTFNEDVSVADVFTMVYGLFLGKESAYQGHLLEISYSIGLAVGILLFFNHFSQKKIHNDPTPIEIEICTYEEESNKTMLERAGREGKTIDAD